MGTKIAPVRRFALALPEVTEEPHFHLSSFRVRGKIFATVPPDEEHIHIFKGLLEAAWEKRAPKARKGSKQCD
jgi:hypothetical protein